MHVRAPGIKRIRQRHVCRWRISSRSDFIHDSGFHPPHGRISFFSRILARTRGSPIGHGELKKASPGGKLSRIATEGEREYLGSRAFHPSGQPRRFARRSPSVAYGASSLPQECLLSSRPLLMVSLPCRGAKHILALLSETSLY